MICDSSLSVQSRNTLKSVCSGIKNRSNTKRVITNMRIRIKIFITFNNFEEFSSALKI